jgi:G3E family GTPase
MDEDKISQFLKEIHEMLPDAQVVPTIHCNVDPEIVLTDRTRVPLLVNYNDLDHHQHDHESGEEDRHAKEAAQFPFISFTFRSRDVFDEACFARFIVNLPWELFRMKGPVRFRDRTVLVNYVGGKKEWSAWDGEKETCLVFIGWSVSEEETIQKLKNCLEAKEG